MMTAMAKAELKSAAVAGAGLEVFARHVYMVGIGGCGMSGLARLIRARGGKVSGADSRPGETTEALAAEGIAVGADTAALPESCDLVVISAAVKPDHRQVLEAERRGLTVLTYAEALGRAMAGRTGVAIAGTHGKSTTTAMLGVVLTDAGIDPSVIVGATCGQLARGALSPAERQRGGEQHGAFVEWSTTGYRIGSAQIPVGAMAGKPGVLVAEACEFNRSFHHFRPTVASISSVEADHLDVYGTLDAVVESFHEFAKLVPDGRDGGERGKLLIAHEGAHRREVTAGLGCEVETIGFSPEADWVVGYEPGSRRVTLSRRGVPVAQWTSLLPGAHNAVNGATACAIAWMLGADMSKVSASLGAFRGIDRRSQFVGERAIGGGAGGAGGGAGVVRVYDDYGHHPTEIDVTLRALRDFEKPQERGGRLICVFQPHQHSRTRHLLEEFASAFSGADVVIVPQIYFVRDSEAEKQRVSAGDLVDRLRARGVRAMHLYPFEAIIEQLENVCRAGDLLVVMGAGPVYEVARGYLMHGEKGGGR